MTRLAWFTPTSSESSFGLATPELRSRLEQRHEIDLFTEMAPSDASPDRPRVFSAHDFVWKQSRDPYDMTVFELADSPDYGFVWPYLIRYPGLVVLHGERFHRSRASSLLKARRASHYWTEFQYDHPDANPDVTRLGIAGLLGLTGELWPMRKVVVESSRLLISPGPWLADTLREEASHDRIVVVEPGVPHVASPQGPLDAIRGHLGIGPGHVLFAAFGAVGPEQRISQILSAFALVGDSTQPIHLVLTGDAVAGFDAASETRRLGLADRVTVTGRLDRADLSRYVAAADVCLCLQWPVHGESFGMWLRCMAAGKPTIVTDVADHVDIPTLDPRDWYVRHARHPSQEPLGPRPDPAGVSIDVIDEDHSLRLAMRRMANDPGLRRLVGEGARRLWERRFGLDRMVEDYENAIARALATPNGDLRQRSLPPSLLHDGTERARSLLAPFGVDPFGMDALAPTDGPEVRSES